MAVTYVSAIDRDTRRVSDVARHVDLRHGLLAMTSIVARMATIAFHSWCSMIVLLLAAILLNAPPKGVLISRGAIAADRAGIEAVYRVCAFLPAIGLSTALFFGMWGRERERQADAFARRSDEVADRIERGLRDLRIKAAQGIVGPKLQDDGIGPVRDRPVQAAESPRRGIARDAGIHNCRGDALRVECPCELCRKCILRWQAKAGRQ